MHDVRTVHPYTLTYTHTHTLRAAVDGSILLFWSLLSFVDIDIMNYSVLCILH